ncbi:MAG: M23 family metallopeptidase [Mycobacteriales bacterium]
MRWSRALLVVGVSLVVVGGTGGPAAAATPWAWPVDGGHEVLRAFAPPVTRYGTGHRGVDVAAGSGVVRAAGAGRVSYAGLLAGRGVVVVVHGALRTTYEPVSAVVRAGQWVEAGEAIGRVDGQHAECFVPCLHWGLLRGEVYLNPLSLLHLGPSRLLPVPAPADRQAAVVPPAVRASAAARVTPLQGERDRAWSLRAARSPEGSGAVLCLLLGLGLLIRAGVRPHGPDPDPVAPALTPTFAAADRSRARTPILPGDVADLDVHRARRRA